MLFQIGFYPPSETAEYTEDSPGGDDTDVFTNLCHSWEAAGELPDSVAVRRVVLRLGEKLSYFIILSISQCPSMYCIRFVYTILWTLAIISMENSFFADNAESWKLRFIFASEIFYHVQDASKKLEIDNFRLRGVTKIFSGQF